MLTTLYKSMINIHMQLCLRTETLTHCCKSHWSTPDWPAKWPAAKLRNSAHLFAPSPELHISLSDLCAKMQKACENKQRYQRVQFILGEVFHSSRRQLNSSDEKPLQNHLFLPLPAALPQYVHSTVFFLFSNHPHKLWRALKLSTAVCWERGREREIEHISQQGQNLPCGLLVFPPQRFSLRLQHWFSY